MSAKFLSRPVVYKLLKANEKGAVFDGIQIITLFFEKNSLFFEIKQGIILPEISKNFHHLSENRNKLVSY